VRAEILLLGVRYPTWETTMAIARTFDGPGWTPEQYDTLIARLVERLSLPVGRSAPGVLFHWATKTDAGMRAVDVYESREAADALVQTHIAPIAQELGLPLPAIAEYDVHGFLGLNP
jgi:hypothetical protein